MIQVAFVSMASAQIVRDGSLGSHHHETLTGGSHVDISASLGKLLCNKNVCNLFHSFSEFNVNTDQTVNFNAPTSAVHIANILARVTGMSRSTIDGLISTMEMPNANFFLINPNGVMFGPNAQLDVGGSFVVTTANEVYLADGGKFEVSTNPDDTLLSSAAPSAFGFLSATPVSVEIDQSTLAVAPGENLSIVSGDVQFTGGNLVAPGGRVNLVAPEPAEPRTLALWEGSNGEGVIDLKGVEPNTLAIRAGHLTIDRSRLTSLNGVNIDINVTDEVLIGNNGAVSVETASGANSGKLSVTADRVFLEGPGATSPEGSDQTGLFSTVHFGAQGNGGSIAIRTNHLEVDGSAQIASVTNGTIGAGGKVTITGRDNPKAQSVVIGNKDASSTSKLLSKTVAQFNGGNGGDLAVSTKLLHVYYGSSIESLSDGIGGNGNVVIDADQIMLDGQSNSNTGIFSSFVIAGSGTPGDIGMIDIETTNLSIINDAQIHSSSHQLPVGGIIQINADSIYLDGAKSQIAVSDTSRGLFQKQSNGLISIQTSSMELHHNAKISAVTKNRNQAGTIKINASDYILLNGPGTALTAAPEPGARGKGGNILIGDQDNPSGDLIMENGSKFTVETQGRGDSGDIIIHVKSASLTDNASITSTSHDSGVAGRITLTTIQDVLLQNGASIQTAALDSNSTGGEVTIIAGGNISMFDSDISAAATGDGGNISFDAGLDIRLTNSLISAEAQFNGGEISLEAGSDIVLANSTISALAGLTGGDLELTAPDLVHLIQSSLIGRAGQDGGQIIIDPLFVILDHSLIDGRSGGLPVLVTIESTIFLCNACIILTNEDEDQPELDQATIYLAPTASLLDAEAQLKPHCAVQFGDQASSFTVSGRGGTPVAPGRWLPSTDLAFPIARY